MDLDPLQIALREVIETKHLLEALITSSETFDYHAAKAALASLRTKQRSLGKLQAEWSAQRSNLPEFIIPFPPPARSHPDS